MPRSTPQPPLSLPFPAVLTRLALGSVLLVAAGTAALAEPPAEGPVLPAAGRPLELRPVTAVETAVIDVATLARRDALKPSWAGAFVPLAILQGEAGLEGGEVPEPETGTPAERYAIPPPAQAPFAPSPAPSLSFIGLDDIPRVGTSAITIPPDVDGAVGPAHVLEGLNNNYRFFDKANGAVLNTIAITSFWSAVGGSGYFDPKTLYDPVQQRWIAVALSNSRSTASSIVVGVSQTSDPTGAWYLYRVLGDSTGVNWADFPCVGFNKNWVAVNVNLFSIASNAGAGARCLILDYAQLRAGTAVGRFATGTGFCSAPAATYSATENTLYVPTHLSSGSGTYRVDTITGTPTSPVYTIGVTRARGLTWTQPSGAILPQAPPLSGTSACGLTPCPIEAQDAQLRSTPVMRAGAIWYAQTVGVPAGTLTHTAVQWTRLDAVTGNVVVGGRIEDPTATAGNGGKWYAYPHIAVNSSGDAVLGFSQFSSTQYAASGYAFRFANDPAGTFRDPTVVHAGEDYYHKDFGGGRNRWGDYSKAQVDPSDDHSLWVVSEYALARTGTDDGTTGTNSSKWGTWWARLGPAVSIGLGPSVAEGDSGSVSVQVPVTLNQPASVDVTVNYSVADGSATLADGDYFSPAGSVVIPAGALTTNLVVEVRGDRKREPDESFTVTLQAATGAPLGSPRTATVTIVNDDPIPAITVTDPAAAEGDAGSAPFVFTLSLTNPTSEPVTVDYATVDETATVADGDYTAASGTATIPAGTLSVTVSVGVLGDLKFEPDERFMLDLSAPSQATLADSMGVATVLNDDSQPTLSITRSASVAEGDTATTDVTLSVTLSNPSSRDVTVDWSTAEGSATVADSDFVAASGTLGFPANSIAAQPVTVQVVGDTRQEFDETFAVVLTNPVEATLAGDTATVTIVNDDPNPVLSVTDAAVAEGDAGSTVLEFVITLSMPSALPVTAQVDTRDGTATAADGDYVPLSAVRVLPPSVTRDTVRVVVDGDGMCEPDELLRLEVSHVTGASPADTVATGTIVNDDECVPPTVRVLAPNGGETVNVTDTIELAWLANDTVGVTSVDLELSRDNGVTFEPLASELADDGRFTWQVTGPVTEQARLRVRARDAAGNVGDDLSDAAWSILDPRVGVDEAARPVAFALTGIVPNPVTRGARVEYALATAAHVRLTIIDLQGRTVATLVDGAREAGRHAAAWDARGPRGSLAAGVYFARVAAGTRVATRRFVITR